MAESFKPTEAVASNARKGLEMRERVKAGTDVGVARARDLSNRRPVSLDTIGRMVSFFARHGAQRPDDEGTEANPTPWLVAWMLWGGDAGRRWANAIWKREGRSESSRGAVREFARMDRPKELRIHNPKGLHEGSPFRTLTAGEPVRDESTGELLGNLDAADLHEMVRVFYAQCDRQEGAPRLNYNHGPSRGGHPDIYGEAVGLFVADDGERGDGLYVVPGWTDYGREFVAKHQTPDGESSVLSNSPEFVRGPIFARGGGGDDEHGELLGAAAFLGAALTPTPQQDERIIDPVRLSRGGDTEAPGPRSSGMDAEKRPDGGMDDLEALKSAHQGLVERLDGLEQMLREALERIEEADDEAEEMGSEPKAEEMACEEPKAEMSREEPADVQALSRRLELADGQREELSRQVAELRAENVQAKADLERQRLRAMGGSADRVERIVKLYTRKLTAPAEWAKAVGDACPYEAAVADLEARPDVEVGKRAGVKAEPVQVEEHTVDAVSAWARENKIGGRFIEQAKAYCKAKGIGIEEVR